MPRPHGAVGLAKSERPPCTGRPQPRPGPLSDPLSLPGAQAPVQGRVGHRPPRATPHHPGDPNLRSFLAPAHGWCSCSHLSGTWQDP